VRRGPARMTHMSGFWEAILPTSSPLDATSDIVSYSQKHTAPWPANLSEVAQTCDLLNYVVRIDKDASSIVGCGIACERQRPQNDLLETEGCYDDEWSSAYRCPTGSL